MTRALPAPTLPAARTIRSSFRPMSRWRRAELVGLAITVPAFYLALLEERRTWVVASYLLAAMASAGATWAEARAGMATTPLPHARRRAPAPMFDGLLIGSLLLCAAAPLGDSVGLLVLRLGAALLIVVRAGEALRPWFWRGGLAHLIGTAMAVLGLSGLGFWWLEPRAQSFGDGLWLAFATAATVGYGDIVPSTPASKIFAVFVVLMGLAVLSLVTAAIAAMWVQSEERDIEREILQDLHQEMRHLKQEIDALRHELAAARHSQPPPPQAAHFSD